jgi:hypothetical protein
MKCFLLATAVLATSALLMPARAEEGAEKPKPDPAKAFAKIDANADGAATKEEFMATPKAQKDPEKAAKKFTNMDTDANGSLSLDEFKAWAQKPKDGNKEGKSSGSSEE